MVIRSLARLGVVGLLLASGGPIAAAGSAKHIVLVVWDGLRPDFVSPQLTPNLYELAQRGVFFQNHHAVYPSATIINGTAMATGAYPGRNGVVGNVEYRPEFDPWQPLATEDEELVRKADEVTQRRFLLRPTVAEILRRHGKRSAIAGTKGVALLHDRLVEGRGDNITLHAGQTVPYSALAAITNQFGPFPATSYPNIHGDAWTTDVLLNFIWQREIPPFTVL